MYIKEINIKNRVYNYFFGNLVRAKKLETKDILINDTKYEDLVIYFTTYVHRKSIKTVSLYYYELMGKVKDKVLDKIIEIISIEKFDDNKILIDVDDKLPDDITFKNVVILTAYVIKDGVNFYPQLFLEEKLYDK